MWNATHCPANASSSTGASVAALHWLPKPLAALPWSTDPVALEALYDQTEATLESLKAHPVAWEHLAHLLEQLKPIDVLVDLLVRGSVLNDIEFFELKQFVFLQREVAARLQEIGYDVVSFSDVTPVWEALDPNATGVVSFYIYDTYSPTLSRLRNEWRQRQPGREGARAKTPETLQEAPQDALQEAPQDALQEAPQDALQETSQDALQEALEAATQEVREALSARLRTQGSALAHNHCAVETLRLVYQKALLAQKYHLVRPQLRGSGGKIILKIKGLFHPEMNPFVPVDVELTAGPTLLSGANMSGKTVLLKTLYLAQTMAQMGLFVPAESAELPVVEEVVLIIGDNQDIYRGLSSFAAEIVALNKVIDGVKAGRKLLVLSDEPARTTNPLEGSALLHALLQFLTAQGVSALISTHYPLETTCRKLRVKGLDAQGNMDYTLVEDTGGSVPTEALRMAARLGMDPAFLAQAQQYMESKTRE